MSRIEENKELTDELYKRYRKNVPLWSQEFYLSVITEAFIDISKSLAVIADSMSEEKTRKWR